MADEVIGRIIIGDGDGSGSGRKGSSKSAKELKKIRHELEMMSGVFLGSDMTKFLKVSGGTSGASSALSAVKSVVGTAGFVTAIGAAAALAIATSASNNLQENIINPALESEGYEEESEKREELNESLEQNIVNQDGVNEGFELIKDSANDATNAWDGMIEDFKEGDVLGVVSNAGLFLKNAIWDTGLDIIRFGKLVAAAGDEIESGSSGITASTVSRSGAGYAVHDADTETSYYATSEEINNRQSTSVGAFLNTGINTSSGSSNSNDQFLGGN